MCAHWLATDQMVVTALVQTVGEVAALCANQIAVMHEPSCVQMQIFVRPCVQPARIDRMGAFAVKDNSVSRDAVVLTIHASTQHFVSHHALLVLTGQMGATARWLVSVILSAVIITLCLGLVMGHALVQVSAQRSAPHPLSPLVVIVRL